MPLHQRGSSGQAGRPAGARASRAVVLGTLAVLGMTVAAGCSTGHAGPGAAASSAARTYVTSCGPARTSADVPVTVEVASGHISCGTAKAVELAYAKAIRSGLEPGNGGGGPVKIMRWTRSRRDTRDPPAALAGAIAVGLLARSLTGQPPRARPRG